MGLGPKVKSNRTLLGEELDSLIRESDAVDDLVKDDLADYRKFKQVNHMNSGGDASSALAMVPSALSSASGAWRRKRESLGARTPGLLMKIRRRRIRRRRRG